MQVFRAQCSAAYLQATMSLTLRYTLYDGSYHEVDSSEMAFKIAGSMAFKEAMAKADPVLTEPIMKVVVITPDEYMGDVIGDLNSRRGQIQSMENAVTAHSRSHAFVPLVRNVRLFHRAPLPLAGTRAVLHGAEPLRGSAEIHSGNACVQAIQ